MKGTKIHGCNEMPYAKICLLYVCVCLKHFYYILFTSNSYIFTFNVNKLYNKHNNFKIIYVTS